MSKIRDLEAEHRPLDLSAIACYIETYKFF